MATKPDPAKIAAALVGGEPLAFKHYPDGSLVVIAPTGQKFRFTPEQVEAKISSLVPVPKKAPEKPSAKKQNDTLADLKPSPKRSSAKT